MSKLDPALSIPDPSPIEAAGYRDVLPMIDRTERIEALVPRGIMTFFIGMPLAIGFLHGHPVLAMINAALLGVLGAFVCRLATVLVLAPLHIHRYGRAMHNLAAMLDTLAPAATLRLQWMAGTPGALAITARSTYPATMLLVDRSTEYRFVSLEGRDIIAIDRYVDEDLRVTMRRRPGLVLGIRLGGGLFGAGTLGGRATATAQRHVSHNIGLRYRQPGDAGIRTSIIPFGPDLQEAETLRITIAQLLDDARASRA